MSASTPSQDYLAFAAAMEAKDPKWFQASPAAIGYMAWCASRELSPQPAAERAQLETHAIKRMAETLGERIQGQCDYDSWGCGYRADSKGNFTIPNVPANIYQFARRIEAWHGIGTTEQAKEQGNE